MIWSSLEWDTRRAEFARAVKVVTVVTSTPTKVARDDDHGPLETSGKRRCYARKLDSRRSTHGSARHCAEPDRDSIPVCLVAPEKLVYLDSLLYAAR